MKAIPEQSDPVQPCAQLQVQVASSKVPPFVQIKEHTTKSERGIKLLSFYNIINTLQLQKKAVLLNPTSAT